jgi:hypothetical protein
VPPGLELPPPPSNNKGKGYKKNPNSPPKPPPPACAYHKQMTAYVGVYGVNVAEFLSISELNRQIFQDFKRALGNPGKCAYRVEAVLDPQYGKRPIALVCGGGLGLVSVGWGLGHEF